MIHKNAILRTIFFLLIFLWCLGFSSGSLINSSLTSAAYPFLKIFYSVVCHQHPEKTIELFGVNLLVCARCTGIYSGALLASALMLIWVPPLIVTLRVLLISVSPMILDVILYSSGVYNYSGIIAFFSGMFSGSVVIIYIFTSFEKLFVELKIKNETK